MSGAFLVDDPANRAAYEALAAALRAGRAIALVGAGSSARAGYPRREELLKRLAKEALLQRPHAEAELSLRYSSSAGSMRSSDSTRTNGRPDRGRYKLPRTCA